MSAEFERNFPRRDILRFAATLGGAALVEAITGCSTDKERSDEAKKSKGEFDAKPTWEQDFSKLPDGPVDPKVWTFETNPEVPGYNNEAQGYTDNQKNVRIKDGRLVIEARREPYSYPDDPGHHYEITSGRIDTRDSLSFEYGKIEAELRLPEGKGTWPAFWMLSANTPHTNHRKLDKSDERFYLHDGELDVMEYYGHDPGQIEATVHTYAKSQEGHTNVPDATTSFHTYGVEVTPEGITWTLDGEPYYEVKKPSENPDKWPFGNGNKLYAILNLAMGGEGGGTIDPHQDRWQMEAKAIRFYELAT